MKILPKLENEAKLDNTNIAFNAKEKIKPIVKSTHRALSSQAEIAGRSMITKPFFATENLNYIADVFSIFEISRDEFNSIKSALKEYAKEKNIIHARDLSKKDGTIRKDAFDGVLKKLGLPTKEITDETMRISDVLDALVDPAIH